MAKRANRLAWGFAAVLALGTVFGCESGPYSGRPFTRPKWLAGSRLAKGKDSAPDNPRCGMVADLKEHYLKRGMTRLQILQLLGKPDESYTRQQFKERTGYTDQTTGLLTDMVEQYTLGEPPGRVDESVLLLKFDRSSRLIDAEILEY